MTAVSQSLLLLLLLLVSVFTPGRSRNLAELVGRSGGRIPSTYSGSCDNSGYQCGQSAEKFFQRIPRVRGGLCTENGAQPWTVEIQVRENGRYVHRCGGSLLSDKFVLTATHCFGGIVNKDVLVVLGQDDLNNAADPAEIAFKIDKYWLHEKFQQEGPYSHDIALLKLSEKGDGCGARYSPLVSPVCLPTFNFSLNSTCYVAGWGKTKSFDSIHPECLRSAEIPLVSHSECKALYSGSSQPILPEMLCAGRKEGGVDACKGDSGGPLVCKEKPEDDHFMLAGVVSWGLGCGHKKLPGVFTSVLHYLPWIEEKMV